MEITKTEFSDKFLQFIKADSPESIIEKKQQNCFMLHDLKLDFDIFEDIMIDLAKDIDCDIDINSMGEFLPKRIGIIDRIFNRLDKKYYPNFTPITVYESASMIYHANF